MQLLAKKPKMYKFLYFGNRSFMKKWKSLFINLYHYYNLKTVIYIGDLFYIKLYIC